MRLVTLAKDSNSGEQGCPSVHRDDDSGRLVLQGPGVDMAQMPNALPLQFYAGDPNFDRFMAGGEWEDTDSKRHWVDLVRRRVADGVIMQRVHVVTEPWSDYVRFEIGWSYPPNVAAGEDVRLIAATVPWPEPDFWMFDDKAVWLMHYTSGGVLDRVEDASASEETVRACLLRKQLALHTGRDAADRAAIRLTTPSR